MRALQIVKARVALETEITYRCIGDLPDDIGNKNKKHEYVSCMLSTSHALWDLYVNGEQSSHYDDFVEFVDHGGYVTVNPSNTTTRFEFPITKSEFLKIFGDAAKLRRGNPKTGWLV
jgi:hypothetical protein